MSDLTVIDMWCGPRTVSTALMYSWRERSDTLVFDEPFYGLYLRHTDPGHPGRDEVLAATAADLATCRRAVVAPGPRPVRFIKNIAHHLDALPRSILDEFTNALLVRDPDRVVASLDATLGPSIPIAITGFPQQVAILEHELAAGRAPVVLDAGRLLADPGRALTGLCQALGVAFEPAMLAWPPGPKPEDGIWARHWYRSVHRSSGFGPPPSGPVDLRPERQALADRCRPLYERLMAHHLDL